MYWLKKRLHTETAVDKDATYRYKLPTTGLYSAFSIQLQAQRYANRASAAAQQHLFEAITKVELLSEGTKVIKSMRAGEIKALNCFDFRRIVPFQHNEAADGYNIDTLYLLAGRSLQDREYMFDMSKLKDPEIAITNALTETLAEYWKVDTLEYEIYGWRAMGSPEPRPKGYFRADERVYYTTTALNAEKLVDITPGKKIRRILLKGWTIRTSIYGHFNKAELQVDEGAYSPVIIDSPMEWALQNKVDYGLDLQTALTQYIFEESTAHQTDAFLPYHSHVAGVMDPIRTYHNLGMGIGNGVLDTSIVMDTGQAFTATGVDAKIDGAGYQRALLIGFDKEKDLSDMLDSRPMGKLKLILTEQAASKVISVVVEEEVLY